MVRPLDSAVPDWTLLESKMAVESKEVCPVESAGLLCRTGLFWSPKRCPVDSAGLVHFQETYNIHISQVATILMIMYRL